jgi:hypothetical protein
MPTDLYNYEKDCCRFIGLKNRCHLKPSYGCSRVKKDVIKGRLNGCGVRLEKEKSG